LVFNTVEKTEEAALFLIAFVVSMVDDPNDSSDNFPILFCDKRAALGVFVKGMLPKSDQFFLIDTNRWNPIRISLIEPPNEIHELPSLLTVLYFFDEVMTHV